MFRNFTQNAIDVITNAQYEAISSNYKKVYPEHFLLGLINQKYAYPSKVLKFANITFDQLKCEIEKKLYSSKISYKNNQIKFSIRSKAVLKDAINISKKITTNYVTQEHIFLALLQSDKTYVQEILSDLNFDCRKTILTLNQMINCKTNSNHPELIQNSDDVDEKFNCEQKISSIFDEIKNSQIFTNAIAKLSASNYEILGSEQIVQSILELKNLDVTKILENAGLTQENFNEKLKIISSREDEFEEKQIVFTPNALKIMLLALEMAKENGLCQIENQHIILSILKEKKGIAYKIFKELGLNLNKVKEDIVNLSNKDFNKTNVVLKLAQEESHNLGQTIVGSEQLLIGILGEGTSIGAKVLIDLGITIKDVRLEIEKIVNNNQYKPCDEISYSDRAKKILNNASIIAKKQKQSKILPEHILLAISTEPKSIAMKVLNNLGVDSLEIKLGINKNYNLE